MAIAPTVERVLAPDEVPENYIRDTGLYLSLRPDTYRYNALDRSNLSDHMIAQSSRYSQINTPLLSIAASEDQVVPPDNHHDKLIDAVADIKAVMLAGAGHSPHHTRTLEVVTSIETFIEGLHQ
jgi:pimeloyl-ACP methyl ester carboxylesterase